MKCNCGIDPKFLTDEHLFAESRELKMLPTLFKRVGMKSFSRVPKDFTLGEGHMLFFLYKPTYTLNRYKCVLAECQRRNIKVQDESYRWQVYGDMQDDFVESEKATTIIQARIMSRIISSQKQFHYDHEAISKFTAIHLLIFGIFRKD